MATLLSRKNIDMTTGSVIKKLIIFAVPIILASMLDKAFNMVDTIMLGLMVNDKAVGAVGATGTIDTLLINLFMGVAGGVSVVVGRCVGARDVQRARRTVGTSVIACFFGGIAFGLIGFFGAETFLTWMNCDAELIPQAVLYMQIYCIGMPILILNNCIAGVLRAVGDSVRPMIYLTVGGVANIVLNYAFIQFFGMTVDGVALAPVLSRLISLILSFIAIRKSTGYSRFEFKYLNIFKSELCEVLKVGIPTGIQGALFSISNLLIASTVNSYGLEATTGISIAGQLDGWMYLAGNAIAVASMSFVSQNFGAKNYKRVKDAIIKSSIFVCIFQFSVGLLGYLISMPFFKMMTQDSKVIEFAHIRLTWFAFTYFICGIMEVLSLSMRAIGKSFTSMVISLIFVCAFRIFWLYTFYLLNKTFGMIYASYPISWILCIMIQIPIIVFTIKKLSKNQAQELEGKENEIA